MNGLPPTVDLSSLVHATVSQVCVAAFQFIINFDVDARVAVESGCEYSGPTGVASVTSYPQAAAQLCELIGKSVQSATRENDGGLFLLFTDGTSLRVLNDNERHESFQVHLGERVFVA